MTSRAATQPLPNPPAPTFFSLARRSFWILFGVIWLIVGSVALAIGIGIGLSESRWASEGREADGMVLTKTIVGADADEGSSTEYRVRYRFSAPGGETVENSDEVSLELWELLTERGPIPIQYLPADPGANRVLGQDGWITPVIMIGFGLIFAPVGGWLVGRELLRIHRHIRLWHAGVPAQAVVTGTHQTSLQINGRHLWVVDYRYTDGAGAEHHGSSGHMSRAGARDWSEGDLATVRYDLARPEQSIWIGQP